MANQRKEHNVEKYIRWLQCCCWWYGSIFIRLAVFASQICEILPNSLKIQTYTVQGHRSWCQSKVHMQVHISH